MHLITVFGVTLAQLCMTASASVAVTANLYKTTDCTGDADVVELIYGGADWHCYAIAGQSIGNIVYDSSVIGSGEAGHATTWSESTCGGTRADFPAGKDSSSTCYTVPFGGVELTYY